MLSNLCVGLLFVALVSSTPMVRERRMTRPLVVDIPAGMFDEETGDSQKSDVPKIEELPTVQKEVIELPKETEVGLADIIPPLKTLEPPASIEDIEVPNRGPENIFGFRFPTVFVIRRPQIRDPFNSFPSFSQFSPFQGFGIPQERPRVPQVQVQTPNRYNVMNHMEDVMKRLQQQMSSLWGNLNNPSYIRPFRPVFPAIESAEAENNEEKSVLNIDNLPANYSNSTSETKIVDGQVVQVNKTIHKISSGNNTSGFFHFQVINIRPNTESPIKKPSIEMEPPAPGVIEEETKPDPVVEKVTEKPETEKSVDDPSLNEVFEDDRKIEEFPYLLNRFDDNEKFGQGDLTEGAGGKSGSSEYEIISKDHPRRTKEIDLSGDIRVNKLMQSKFDKAPYLMINEEPDVEIIDV